MGSRARVTALLAAVVGSGLLFAATWPLDAMVPRGQLGPGFWPRLVLIGLAVACLLKLREERRAGSGDAASPEALARVSAARLALGMACILAYVVAAPQLGFPVATAAFIVTFMVVAGARGRVGIAATAVLGTVVLLYTFIKLVYLPFPKGAGPFEQVTLALYRALGIF
ncbi:MAG TPA: tripartite tricarboxylate transporter TctB family protein [Methylomirabilota bacterium]|jgi:putative tricarboxylic transport membrane protein|nr:tripartite tricarboxylate transporter TctB family protein [Methylomirabilota bacterium]